ncbi:hypothetical protein EDC96DRAFT_606992 [Choanephora cucurbitarum]|nr:hypothetical protein EDC96DRAFT_606992 [Choanephora cucurbitarum]
MSLEKDLSFLMKNKEGSLLSIFKLLLNRMNRGQKRIFLECIICINTFETYPLCQPTQCDHSVCQDCLRKYVDSILQNTSCTTLETIECASPGCPALFNTMDLLQTVLNETEVNDWWNQAIMKSCILNKIQCPFEDCKALFDASPELMKQCAFSECYECRRGFCVACQNHWHPGEIKILNDEEAIQKTLQYAQDIKWTRCPTCENIVEKSKGCTTMFCKCGTTFCYRCGGFSKDHDCINRCQGYSDKQLLKVRQDMFNHTYRKLKLRKVA